MIWVTPDMDRLFTDGAVARRRFLDRLIYGYDAAHAGRINAYEQAMRARARLLRDGRRDRRFQFVELNLAAKAEVSFSTFMIDLGCAK